MIRPAFACATSARERADPPGATAVTARRWLLIEHPGPWAFDAFAGSGIVYPVRAALTAAVRANDSRLLLVRRPGRRIPVATRSWAVIDNLSSGGGVWGTWHHDDDLLAAIGALEGAVGEQSDRPVLLVCTHGRHDTCCAVRGRPVAAVLQERWPDATWECSHVGGDRFAANVIVLPTDTYYGNLDEDNVERVISDHLDGRVDPTYLRGMGTERPPAQAAVVEAHRAYGPAAAGDVVSTSLRALGPDRWEVRLHGSGPVPAALVATVRAQVRPVARLTCQAKTSTSARTYVVDDLRLA